MKGKDIISLFLSKNIILGACSLLLTSVFAYPFFELANYLAFASYESVMSIKLKTFVIFYFHFDIFAIICLSLIASFILFTLIPMRILKKIIPSRIVNNKTDD